jgi:hypothetical protein
LSSHIALSKALRGDDIVIDYVQHGSFALGYAQQRQKAPTLHVTKINVAVRMVSDAHVTAVVAEFPTSTMRSIRCPHSPSICRR